jgi:polyisoprenoid-binding protein YceI
MKLKALPVLVLLIAACSGNGDMQETQDPTPAPASTSTVVVESPIEEPTQKTTAQVEANQSSQFVIQAESSEVRFYIDEVLRGQPKKVEGITQEISGSVLIESLDPLSVSIQPIEIQAGTFVTDNNFRNRAISDAILQTGRYPTIVFTPTDIDGLPDSAKPGSTYSFDVTGDLKIRDITLPATFQVTLIAQSEDVLSGSAAATINRTDYGLNIPSVPQVADVSEQVLLEFDFNASRSG